MRRIIPAIGFFALLAFFALLPAFAQDRGLAVVARDVTGQADFDVGRQMAVIIGIDKYKEWPALRSAVSEAKKVKAALEERYYIDEFVELYDDAANAAGIRRLFSQELPSKLGIRDSLLVFYAGHGYLDASKLGFWIASDGTKDELTQGGWIPNAQIRNYLGNLKAQRILVLADSCFSGDFLNVHRGAAPTVDSAYYQKALQLTARQVLTSGASESVPDESEFGAQLVNLLERNTEKLLDPYAMYDRIKLGVSKTLPLMGSMPGNEQGASFVLFLKPPSGGGGGAGSEAAAAAKTGAPPPPAVPAPPASTLVLEPAYGSIVVNSAQAGSLYLDGASVGELPAGVKGRIAKAEAGDHNLEIRYSSGDSARMNIHVEEGADALANFAGKEPAVVVPAAQANSPVAQAYAPATQGNAPAAQGNPRNAQTNAPLVQANPRVAGANPPLGQTNPPLGQGNPPLGQTNPPLGQVVPSGARASPPMAGGVQLKILEHKGSVLGRDPPNWVRASFEGPRAVERLPDSAGQYIVILQTDAPTLVDAQLAASKLDVKAGIASMLSARLRGSLAGVLAGEKDKLEAYAGRCEKKVSETRFNGFALKGDWWVKLQPPDAAAKPDKQIYRVVQIWGIDKAALEKQIRAIMKEAAATEPNRDKKQRALDQIQESVFETF